MRISHCQCLVPEKIISIRIVSINDKTVTKRSNSDHMSFVNKSGWKKYKIFSEMDRLHLFSKSEKIFFFIFSKTKASGMQTFFFRRSSWILQPPLQGEKFSRRSGLQTRKKPPKNAMVRTQHTFDFPNLRWRQFSAGWEKRLLTNPGTWHKAATHKYTDSTPRSTRKRAIELSWLHRAS